MLYSKSTNGFYDPTINTEIPSDAVEITAEQHIDLMTAQSQGKVIVGDANGYPVAITPTVTPEQLIKQRINELRQNLSQTEYKFNSDYDRKDTQEWLELKAQRQAWRDEIRELEA